MWPVATPNGGSSELYTGLSASHEGMCFMKLVSKYTAQTTPNSVFACVTRLNLYEYTIYIHD